MVKKIAKIIGIAYLGTVVINIVTMIVALKNDNLARSLNRWLVRRRLTPIYKRVL